MTLGEARGAALVRMVDMRAIGAQALDYEIGEAVREVHDKMRHNRHRAAYVRTVLPLQEGQNLIELPEDVASLVMVERLDLGAGCVVLVDHVPVGGVVDPVLGAPSSGWPEEIQVGSMEPLVASAAQAYSMLPGRKLRLYQKPAADIARGLRLTYVPRLTPATKPDQPLPLPEELGYAVTCFLLRRLSAQVAWKNPQAVRELCESDYQRFLDWLQPASGDEPNLIPNRDVIYMEV